MMPDILELQDAPDRLFEPQHTVQIRHEVNDTELPGLSIDYEKVELSVNWREMYCRFFAEEHLVKKIMAEKRAELERLAIHLKSSNMDMEKMMMEAMTKFADIWESAKLEARRARVRQQFREKHDIEYDEGRDEGLLPTKRAQKSLMRRTQYVGLEEYSDDEEVHDDEPRQDTAVGLDDMTDEQWLDESGEFDGISDDEERDEEEDDDEPRQDEAVRPNNMTDEQWLEQSGILEEFEVDDTERRRNIASMGA